MASPYITTARGVVLNFDQLVEASSRPMGHKETKSEVKSSRANRKNKPINVAGFVPAAGKTTFDESKLEPTTPAIRPDSGDVTRTPHTKNRKSISELTAVRVTNKSDKTKDDVDSVEDLVAGKGVMNDIMSDLDAANNAPEGYVDEVGEDAEAEIAKNADASKNKRRSR